jgi:hypothetical protein
VIAMTPKGNSQKNKNSRKGITLKIKQEIVEKSENPSTHTSPDPPEVIMEGDSPSKN